MKFSFWSFVGVGFLSIANSAAADITPENVSGLSPHLLTLAYEEIVRERYDFHQTNPMSFTSLSALRDYVPEEQWDGLFRHAVLAGWDGIHGDFARSASANPNFIGAEFRDIESLSLFDQFEVKVQRWTFHDTVRARAMFHRVAVSPGAEISSDDVVAIRAPGGRQSDQIFVGIEGRHLTVSLKEEHLPVEMPVASKNDPNIAFLQNSYIAMIRAAHASVPDNATIVEVALYNWSNVEEPTDELPFPQNIAQDQQYENTDSAPFYGIAVIDWRLPGQQIGMSLAFNHLDACEAASGFPALLEERWKSVPVLSDLEPAKVLPADGAFELYETQVAGADFCATTMKTHQIGTARPEEYVGANPIYQTAHHIFHDHYMMISAGFFEP